VVVSQEDVNDALAIFIQEFHLPEHVVSSIRFHMYSKLIHIPHGNEMIVADGFTDNRTGDIILSVFTPCLGRSGMMHELAHVFFVDKNHENKVIWEKVKALEDRLKERCTAEQLAIEEQKRNPIHGNTR